jgi:hypothetical protein
MIEVFKTDITDRDHATMLISEIQKIFVDYKANVDLHDCDNILRVENKNGGVQSLPLILLLNSFGFTAEILLDTVV